MQATQSSFVSILYMKMHFATYLYEQEFNGVCVSFQFSIGDAAQRSLQNC